ncbi:MAG TPA: 30S ribosomal protein S11 [Caldisericia bacterium]|nr:30S ribosomal protein S11 [Caldisericia bacterium]HPF49305.1 30S ribosomal protein S11 [Caldisericia bacterium]HPI84015.1 30S ribosomal protein S11 [Caldisericia bacterium]HPQ93273.1 30S ribosomal protein S11 [Caldisericia bacterium]HRV75345.1 30S ribosomal protein S11 [Caldisericia bacterium]
MAKQAKTKKRVKKLVADGRIYIHSSFNNCIVTVTDRGGDVLAWSSGGHAGFKGTRKGTAFAAQVAAQNACKKALDMGMKEAKLIIKGPGSGRETAIRAIGNSGITITSIKDVTPIPHNGCRPPKMRRV